MRLFQAQKAWKQPFLLYISMFACDILNWKYKMKHKFFSLDGISTGYYYYDNNQYYYQEANHSWFRMIHIRMNERQLIRTMIGKLGENDR